MTRQEAMKAVKADIDTAIMEIIAVSRRTEKL